MRLKDEVGPARAPEPSAVTSGAARFIPRTHCVACGEGDANVLGQGRFGDQPLRSFIERDPWGVSPLPFIEKSTWEWVECRACGQTFHRWVLDDTWQRVRFAEWMGLDAICEFERRHGLLDFATLFRAARERTAHVLRIETLTRPMRGRDPVRLLDFGCGFGKFVMTAALSGFDAAGVDWDAHRAPAQGGVLGRYYHSLEELDAGDGSGNSFHAITAFQVFEHLTAPRDALGQLRARLVKGGVLVIEVPDTTAVRGLMTEADYAAIHPLEHINGFTPKTLAALAYREGFEPIPTPKVFVTTEATTVIRQVGKRVLRRLLPATTAMYFRLA